MPFFFFDPTMILLIPAFVLAVWAQIKVKTTYNKFKKIAAANGLRGAEVAKYILQKNGIYDVEVEPVPGELSDHYDPRVKKSVFRSTIMPVIHWPPLPWQHMRWVMPFSMFMATCRSNYGMPFYR